MKKLLNVEEQKHSFLETIGVKPQPAKSKAQTSRRDLPVLQLSGMDVENSKQFFEKHF